MHTLKLDINGTYPKQGANPFRGCFALVTGTKKEGYKVASLISPCTDHLLDGLSGSKNDRAILYCHDKLEEYLPVVLEQLHFFEKINGYQRTRIYKLEKSLDKYLIVPDKRILKYTILASLYLKIFRNVSYHKVVFKEKETFNNFWKNPSDTSYLKEFSKLTGILFNGKLQEIVKTSPSKHGLLKGYPTHATQGIVFSLQNPNATYFGQEITRIQKEEQNEMQSM